MLSIPPLGIVESRTLLKRVRRPVKMMNVFFLWVWLEECSLL